MERENQKKIQSIFLKAMIALEQLSSESNGFNFTKAAGQLLEWTDQRVLLKLHQLI
jgi:hypothetical protein